MLLSCVYTEPNPPPKNTNNQLRLLLAAGLEATSRDEDGRTAAEAALMSGHLKAFELLTSRAAAAIVPPPPLPGQGGEGGGGGGGAGAVVAGEEGVEAGMGPDKTPLHAAAECGSVAAVLR